MQAEGEDDGLETHPKINHDGHVYVYVQVADLIAERIRTGDLRIGDRLRSERDIAEEYGVAYMSVRRAMQELRERGLIATIHGRGTYVVQVPVEE